jgi:hypothetical protein
MTIDELKLLIATKLDVTEFLDILGMTMFELVEALEPAIQENYQELVRACE